VTSNLSVGDASLNLFLGSNSGNLIGNNAGDTAVGYNAAGGISNVQNSVAIGKNAMQGVTDASGVVCIGVDTVGGGTQSIYIGAGTRGSGSKNIILGSDISVGNVSNRVVVGNLLQGDQFNRSLDVCTNQTVVWGKLGIQRVPQRSFEVLGDAYSTDGFVTGAGSVSRPAFRFELDNSTGLYWTGSNQIAAAVGGIQRLAISDGSATIFGDLRVTGNFSSGSGGGGGGVVGGIIDVSGMTFSQYIRDNSTNPVLYDISSGNISNSRTTTSSNFVSASGSSNTIGGLTLSNIGNTITVGNGFITDISTSPYFRLGTSTTSFQVDMSGGNISNSGTHIASNFVSAIGSSNSIGGLTLSNIGNTITLGNGFITDISTSPYFRLGTSTTSFQVDMSGGNISNSGTTTSSNFVSAIGSSNNIGGLTLSNIGNTVTIGNGFITDISTSPYFRLGTSTTSFQVDMSGGNIFTSNRLFTGSGTAAAPAYSFQSDVSMGLYDPATNVLGFVTSGVERMRIDASGRVGIGLTNPSSLLDIRTTLSNPMVNLSTSGGSGSTGITCYSTVLTSGTFNAVTVGKNGVDTTHYGGIRYTHVSDSSTSNYVSLTGGTGVGVNVLQNGRVGIATTTPAYTLDICGSAGTASVNIATWPRASVSNVLVIRGVDGTVGNTINFSNTGVQNTIHSNLMTYSVSNGTTGASFRFLKSGIWSISYFYSNDSGDSYTWMDVSTNDVASGGLLVAGSPVIANMHASSTHNPKTLSFTGYLPSNTNNYYKFRAAPAANVKTGNDYFVQIMLLYETPNSAGTFPYF
jgi:hypothetical protein